MAIHLVPLPPDHVEGAAGVWLPFVTRIAERDQADPAVLIDNVLSGAVHLVLAWDDDAKCALALMGVQFVMRGDERRAHIIWLTGEKRELWTPLLPELERYLREHQRCTGSTITCRPGWSPTLKTNGYRTTHLVLEKDFAR